MAKPDIDDIRWAQDPAALNVATTSAQWNLGWVAPGGVEENPILNYQNYWQNSVQKWIEWSDSAFPDVSNIDQQVIDLHEWETGHQDFNRFPTSIVPQFTSLSYVAPVLSLNFMPPAGAVAANWDSQKSDTWLGSRYYEMIDIMARGLGLQVNDGNGDTWLFYCLAGGIPVTITPGVSSMAPGLGLAVGASGLGNISVFKNGVEQLLPTNKFSTFAPILDNANSGAFSALNPNGWRVMLVGVNAISTKFPSPNRGIVRGLEIRRRWIRPIDVARSDAVTQLSESCNWELFTLPATKGSALRVTYNINLKGAAPTSTVSLYATQALDQEMVRLGSGTKTDPTYRGTAFPVLQSMDGLVISVTPGKGFKRALVGLEIPCVTLYDRDGPINWVKIEELY